MSRKERTRAVSFLVAGIFAALVLSFLYPQVAGTRRNYFPYRQDDVLQESALRIVPEPSDRDHILWKGSDDVVVVEYFDIDCRYCRGLLTAQDNASEDVKSKVRLIIRPFPLLDIYPHSLERAVIAECVSVINGDDAFFNFLRAVSQSYREYEEKNDWLMAIAERFVDDKAGFRSCVQDQSPMERIRQFRSGGYAAGIFSVPSFLVAKKGSPVARFDLLGPVSGMRLLQQLAASQ